MRRTRGLTALIAGLVVGVVAATGPAIPAQAAPASTIISPAPLVAERAGTISATYTYSGLAPSSAQAVLSLDVDPSLASIAVQGTSQGLGPCSVDAASNTVSCLWSVPVGNEPQQLTVTVTPTASAAVTDIGVESSVILGGTTTVLAFSQVVVDPPTASAFEVLVESTGDTALRDNIAAVSWVCIPTISGSPVLQPGYVSASSGLVTASVQECYTEPYTSGAVSGAVVQKTGTVTVGGTTTTFDPDGGSFTVPDGATVFVTVTYDITAATPGPSEPQVAVSVAGDPRPGSTLTASVENIPPGATLEYDWFDPAAPSFRTSDAAYTVTPDDVGRPLTVAVTVIEGSVERVYTADPVTVLAAATTPTAPTTPAVLPVTGPDTAAAGATAVAALGLLALGILALGRGRRRARP